ncbi:cyanophycin synthetase family protein [Raoultibacter timonensis]|uniref:Cyanophycin synthase-like N-terminal domain-containing protein n=1 Tax=Raoultibacter timonensis TaxID=1907662 RepID=A0ABN6MAU9_9ACTN|nr:hypothetical protein [Raoultibacter timonensis]BDE95147.1 hypothetical protein CE91St30_04800 [Raoultibacter timonensis]BDF49750.1 hypothetical protein CE91St31_04800 [Raoultibacter timonensis]
MTEAPDPLRIESLVVQPGRIVCEVAVDPSQRYTTPRLAATLLGEHPTLAGHACVNEVGDTFGCVIERTPVPHLLEHLVIDLQARSGGRPDDTFVGTTEWVDEARGRATVQVSFTDDLVALRAFRDASEKIIAAMLK